MAALRLLALDGTTNSGFDRRVMDWHDVVMGQTEYINSDNERKAYLMLESVCKKLAVKAKNELHVLSVSEATRIKKNCLLISFSRKSLKYIQRQKYILLLYTFQFKFGKNQVKL